MNHEAFVAFSRVVDNTAKLLYRGQRVAVAAQDPERATSVPHLGWMLCMALTFYTEGETDKASRWVGFVQGALCAHEWATLDELRDATRPPLGGGGTAPEKP